VRAVVDGVIRLPSGIAPRALAILRRGLTFPNPEYMNRVRFSRWVGATPEEITLFEEASDGTFAVPRGAARLVREALGAVGESVAFDDRRAVLPTVVYRFAIELREYQERAVAALARAVQGTAIVPCGGGKTVIGAGLIARLGQPALVIVHTCDLLDQWREAIGCLLGIEAGVVAAGRVDPGDVTIATVQTLAAMSTGDLVDLGRRSGTVIVDEAHHVPALTFRSILPAFPAKFRFGLTATPERADGLTPLLELAIGAVAFRIGHGELVAAGHLVVPRIEPVETGCSVAAETYGVLMACVVHDAQRNDYVADLVAREAEAGRTVLVLSGRIIHCRILVELLRRRDISAEALTGAVERTRRAAILERFRAGTLRVVCATSLADEGLDVARLDRLILATPARAEGRTIQRLGRLMRPHPGKEAPVLYDLVDDIPLARRQFAARKRAYRSVLGDAAGTVAPRPSRSKTTLASAGGG